MNWCHSGSLLAALASLSALTLVATLSLLASSRAGVILFGCHIYCSFLGLPPAKVLRLDWIFL